MAGSSPEGLTPHTDAQDSAIADVPYVSPESRADAEAIIDRVKAGYATKAGVSDPEAGWNDIMDAWRAKRGSNMGLGPNATWKQMADVRGAHIQAELAHTAQSLNPEVDDIRLLLASLNRTRTHRFLTSLSSFWRFLRHRS